MADDLARLGYADDAAQETQELILELRQARNRIVTSRGRLYKLWKAKEWWESCDYSEDTFKECLAEYRGDTKEVPNDTND
ncbi:MAG: hypothetical protein IMZ62_07605 [Chloroflexi bacterium]|nr:hypothetical protein [Chloroflexota bacterium]